MRKILTMVSLLLCLTAVGAWGQSETGDGWSYDEETQTLTITGDNASGFVDEEEEEISIENVVINNSVKTLAEEAFAGHEELLSVTFQDNCQLEELPSGVFKNCGQLANIIIPAGLETLGEECLMGTAVSRIDIPASVTTIGDRAFFGCWSLQILEFAKDSKLESIGSQAFYDCQISSELKIPASVTKVGFLFLRNGNAIMFLGDKAPTVEGDSEDILGEPDYDSTLPIGNPSCTIFVKDLDARESFLKNETWKRYENIVATGAEFDFTKQSSAAGEGYSWSDNTLTLTDGTIQLKGGNENGIVLPGGAKIVLSGTSTVKYPGSYGTAIKGMGDLTIEGGGSLTLESGFEAIKAEGDLTISDGSQLHIHTSGESLNGGSTNANDILIENSTVDLVAATDDGFWCTNLVIKGSNVAVTTTQEECCVLEGKLEIEGSKVNMTSGAKEAVEADITVKNSSTVLLSANYHRAVLGSVSVDGNSSLTVKDNTGVTTKSKASGALRGDTGSGLLSLTVTGNSVADITTDKKENVQITKSEDALIRIKVASQPKESTVYGTYTPTQGIVIEENENFVIPKGSKLVIQEGTEVTNKGTIIIADGGTLEGETPEGTVIGGDSPAVTTYYDLHLQQGEGATLVSRHGKQRVKAGGSFTLSLEMSEGYEDCRPTVYVKRGRFGEWEELKIDEVSGYYQIRNVQSTIYAKVEGDGIYPVANEDIVSGETEAYAADGKVVVTVRQPERVYVVSMEGAIVAAAEVDGRCEFDVPSEGVYIVRIGAESYKLHVK